MDPIKRLQEQLKSLNASITAIVTKADAEKRDLTDDEQKQITGFKAEFDKAKAQLETRMAARSVQDEAGQSAGRRVAAGSAMPHITGGGYRNDDQARAGFRDIAEFANSVHDACRPGGRIDPRLHGQVEGLDPQAAPTNYHNEGAGADGGFAVPPAMRQEIWDAVAMGEDVLNWVNVEPTELNAVEVTKDETTPWGSTGIIAYWRAEAALMTATKSVLKQDTLRLQELYAFVTATDELLSDAPRLANRLTSKAAQAILWKASDAIVNGDGVGKPLGWFKAASLVSIGKEANQAADTIVADNIAKMYSRLLRVPGSTPFWLLNPDAWPQLLTLKIGDQPIWTPPQSGFKEAPGGFLLGLPVRPSEHCQTLGDAGDIQLVDPAGYYATQKAGGIKADSSIHLYFDYGVTAFRWMFRMAGQPFLSAAVAAANGSSTKSHAITIEART